jgi:cytochrome c biogenesis protein CcmG/thiol:disulfide interchange protein DsbE
MTVLPRLEEHLADAVRASHARTRRAPHLRRRSRRAAFVLAATLAISATTFAATRPWTSLDDAVEHGQRPPAPDRALPLLGTPGSESLERYRGKVVVVNFFASWCEPCLREAPLLDRIGRRLEADGTGTVLLVSSMDALRDAKRFVAAHDLAMPVLADRRGLLARDYALNGLPSTFVIDREGRVVAISRGLATRRFLDAAIARAR